MCSQGHKSKAFSTIRRLIKHDKLSNVPLNLLTENRTLAANSSPPLVNFMPTCEFIAMRSRIYVRCQNVDLASINKEISNSTLKGYIPTTKWKVSELKNSGNQNSN